MKGSDNPFPSLLVVEGAAPASPAVGDQRLFIDSADHKLKRKDSSGTVTTVEGGTSGGSGLLAATSYGPSSTTTVYSTTSTTFVDVDATNLAVTFTAPTSGTVIVCLSAWCDLDAIAAKIHSWGLRSGASDVAGSHRLIHRADFDEYGGLRTYRRRFTGLTAGNSYTWKWSYCVSYGTGTARIQCDDGTPATGYGPALMEVWSA